MEMIGNTIYYPGMEFFLDPRGIGFGDEFNPTLGPDRGEGASVANKLVEFKLNPNNEFKKYHYRSRFDVAICT